MQSLETIVRASSRALVIGVGGGGDVVGALATARFLEFCGRQFVLGGLSWERSVYDPIPGPRKLCETRQVRSLHPFAWMATAESRTDTGVYFAESKMAAALDQEILLVDINGGVRGVAGGLESALKHLRCDLLVGIDVGGDSLAEGHESGLRSPLADSIMLAAFAELEKHGRPALWGVFGYGSDGELSMGEIERALSRIGAAGGMLGAWALTPAVATELARIIETVPTEASAIPVECFRGAWGERKIRGGERTVKLTPLTTLTFFMAPAVVFETLSAPARAVRASASLEQANDSLHELGIKTELDLERERHRKANAGR